MRIEKEINNPEKIKSAPEPAESFEVEFLNARGIEIREAISRLGFSFRRSGSEEKGRVYFEGESSDGSKIRITIEKGENYKSPAEKKRNSNNS